MFPYINDYYECKFYNHGFCEHEDAPNDCSSCLGKNDCGSWQDNIKHKRNINGSDETSGVSK
jgi:hypothetical protein